MPTVSIIIRTLNEARHVGQLLDAVSSQDSGPLTVEVVVVDSGSTDGTLDIVRQYGCRILTIDRSAFSFGRSLNLGCDAARGELLVFVSGHCVPVNRDWLRSLCQPLIDGSASYSYGRQIGGAGTQFSEKQIFAKYFPAESLIPQSGYYCNNANAAIDADAWRAHRFDEALTGLEDMHLAKRLVDAGHQIAYVSGAVVYHLHDESWSQVRRRFEREALALQEIMPHVHIRQRDVVRYIATSIWMDLKQARRERCALRCAADIVRYRYHQYIGSYLGNRVHQELSHIEKERYFYPDDRRLDPDRPVSRAAKGVRARAAVTSDD